MARALWIPSVLRGAGLTVHEEPGWRTRGGDSFAPVAVVAHGTGGSRTSTDRGEINWICYNSPIRPVSQLYLSRSGAWWVLASGRCNHIGDAGLPGTGRSGNGAAIGIEAQHASGEPWTDRQYDSYVRGCAAIHAHTGWGVSRLFGHYEVSSTGKTDPYFDMDPFRERVKAAMEGDDMALSDKIQFRGTARNWIYERWGMAAATVGGLIGSGYGWSRLGAERDTEILALVKALAADKAGCSVEDLEALLRQEHERAAEVERAERRAEMAALVEQLGPALVDELRDAAGDLPADVVEAACGRALARVRLTVGDAPAA